MIGGKLTYVVETLKAESKIAIDWFNNNLMEANPDKFQSMILGYRGEIGHIDLGENRVTCEESVKLLGIHIDKNLNFKNHIQSICKKAGAQLNVLSRLHQFLDTESKLALVQSFIISNFNYCPLIWHFCTRQSTDRLEKLMKRALRIAYGDYESAYATLLDRADLTSLELGRLHILATEIYKAKQGISPPYVADLFDSHTHNYNTRAKNQLAKPSVNTTGYGLHSLRFLGPKIWNELPFEIKASENLITFKNKIKTWEGISCKCSLCR